MAAVDHIVSACAYDIKYLWAADTPIRLPPINYLAENNPSARIAGPVDLPDLHGTDQTDIA
jgi:hypothetical protein